MCVVLSSTGSEFYSVGPETAKLRGPVRTVRVRGTARFPCAADRRRWEPLPTGEIIWSRYEGTSPCRPLQRPRDLCKYLKLHKIYMHNNSIYTAYIIMHIIHII